MLNRIKKLLRNSRETEFSRAKVKTKNRKEA